MADQNEDTEKSFDPTPRKLEQARKKGDVPRSTDLNATAGYAGLFLAFVITSAGALWSYGTSLMVFLDQPADLAELFFGGPARAPIGQIVSEQLPFIGILFGLPALAVLLSAIAQQSITFAPSKLSPRLDRVSPISIAKQKFGRAGLFEFAKSFTKLLVISAALAIFIYVQLPEITMAHTLSPVVALPYLGQMILGFLACVIVVSAAIGSVDFLFQRFDHQRKLRMSRKEMQDESKENDGDPKMKQERMRRGRSRALSQNLRDVDTADVVITNPTHYAIALHWSREPGTAPVCVAKGMDALARTIRERAITNGVPIHEDPPTARALHAMTDVGEQIPIELYQAVATAIRFAEELRARKRAQGLS